MAGLMRTTSRSESENHFFGKWTSPHLTLIEFLSHYDTAIDYQRYIERKNDHDSRYKIPAFKTDLPMEKEACKLYTRTLFFDVQDEMFASYKYCIALSVVQTENTETYSVRDTQYHIFKGSDQFPFYQEFPKNYLHKRWLKNVKPSSFDRRRITGASDVVQSEVLELYQIFESSIDRLVHDLDKLHIYKDKMKELLNQAEIDVPTVPKVSSKAVMSAMLGVDEPENVLIGNPNVSKVKGTGCFSRMKLVAEVTAEELAKRRTVLCGVMEGHNKRTCTNEPASKKPKVQAAPKQQASQPRKYGLRSRAVIDVTLGKNDEHQEEQGEEVVSVITNSNRKKTCASKKKITFETSEDADKEEGNNTDKKKRKLKQVDTTVLSDEEEDQGSRPKKQRKKSKKLDIQVIVNEEAEENEESKKYEDKCLQKKKRKGKKVEFVENEMVEDEMEPPISETVSKKESIGDKRKKDNVEAKIKTVKKKVFAAERLVCVKKGKQKINEGYFVSFKEGKKDKDERVLMVVEKGKEVVLNEKVKRDPVSVLEELGLGEYHNNFNFTSTPGKLGLWIVNNYDHEELTIKMVDGRKIKVTRELIHEILGVPMGEIKVNALLNTMCEDETTTDCSTISPSTVVERKAPIFKHWSTKLLKKRQVEEEKNGGFGQLPILEGLELIEKPKKNLKKKKSKQNILEIGSMRREEELEQFKSKSVQDMNDCLRDNLSKIKALLLDTNDKIKIALYENPEDIDLKMIIEKRLAFFKELNHRDDDNVMVVLDNGNDVPKKSVKDNDEINREKDVENVVDQDVDKPEDVEKESEFGNDENHNDSENKEVEKNTEDLIKRTAVCVEISKKEVSKGVLAINEDTLKDSQSETLIIDIQPKDSQHEAQDSQSGMEKGGEIQEDILETVKSRKLALSFMRPFGCPVTILNTIDHLGKFDGKADEGFFVGYSTNSKTFRVFNIRARIVEENLHVQFSETTPNIVGSVPNLLFDIDVLTKSLKYKPVVAGNQSNDPQFSSSSKDSPNARFKPSGEEEKKNVRDSENKDSEVPSTKEPRVNQEKDANINRTNNINNVSPTVNVAGIKDNVVDENIVYGCVDDPNITNLEEIVYSDCNTPKNH
ncbi:FAR1 DNA binding domain, zinc finger, SWIM-type, MULE transposase domain containing protein [Tanacetum coccineum]